MKPRIPKKIDDSSLKDAVVEFRYSAALPPNLLLGVLYQSLPTEFKIAQFNPAQVLLAFDNGPQAHIGGVRPDANLFISDQVRLQISENALIFNILNSYPGWTAFSTVIRNTLRALTGPEKITNYHRIGIRFISEFQGLKIFDKIGGNCKLELPGWEQQRNTVFKTERVQPDHTVVVNLANNVVRPNLPEQFFSLIDIDVFHQFETPQTDTDQLFRDLDALHNIEKETFFGLLSDDFLQSLHPQY